MYNKLMKIKEVLVEYTDNVNYKDPDSIEYLIDTIDYLCGGKVPCTPDIINILIEEVMVCNTYHKTPYLNKVVGLFYDILKELNLCTI